MILIYMKILIYYLKSQNQTHNQELGEVARDCQKINSNKYIHLQENWLNLVQIVWLLILLGSIGSIWIWPETRWNSRIIFNFKRNFFRKMNVYKCFENDYKCLWTFTNETKARKQAKHSRTRMLGIYESPKFDQYYDIID